MAEKPPDAPYLVVWEDTIIDGKKVAIYYLGGKGLEVLKNAVCKDQCELAKTKFEIALGVNAKEIKELKSMLNVLTDLIGGPSAMVEYFRKHVLVQLGEKSCRTGDLIFKPYSDFKQIALQELLKEDKIVHTRNGWWKLGRI